MGDTTFDIGIWGAAGGQGATTITAVLAISLGLPAWERVPGELGWIVGEQRRPAVGHIRLIDCGVWGETRPISGRNVVVLRGPCLAALRRLSSTDIGYDSLILVKEPWRATTTEEVSRLLGVRVDQEVDFSERASRLIDAGLLGMGLYRIPEFQELIEWGRIYLGLGSSLLSRNAG